MSNVAGPTSPRVSKKVAQPELTKSVSFFGLVALGLGGVWGTSWLLVASAWLDQGGGVINALLAWVLILILELPFVLAYRQAVPMFPRAEGELSYAEAAFGKSVGFWAAWFGVLVNLILCAYEVVAIVRMVGFLWPGVTTNYSLYSIQGSPVGVITIVIGIVMVLGISLMHFRGVKLSSNFQKVVSTGLMVLVAIGVVMAFALGSFHNYLPAFGKPAWQGILAVVAMLPFSMAGWESIAKGAEEAKSSETSGKAVPIAWAAGWVAYVVSLIATGLVMPWKEGALLDMPFATGLDNLTGSKVAGYLLIVTALIGCIGVYNALFYSLTRQLYGMAREGLMPRWLTGIDEKHRTPTKAIVFVTIIILVAPFLGRTFLLSFVDAASFAYIVLWGLTFLSIVVLQRRYRGTEKAFKRPGGPVVEVLGFISIVFLFVVMLYPGSPGALIWPTEHIILVALIVLGAVLYLTRHERHEGALLSND